MAESEKDENFPKIFLSWDSSDEHIVPHLERIANYSKIEHLFDTPEKLRSFYEIFVRNVSIAQRGKRNQNYYRANYTNRAVRYSSGLQNPLWSYNYLNLYREQEQSSIVSEPDYKEIIRLDDTIRVEGLIKNVYKDNEELFRVDPRDFERMIAELLRQKNFMTELTKTTRDGGIDIIAIKEMNGFSDKYLIQCKRHGKGKAVDVGVVRELFGIVNRQNANKGIIFTSSYFSAPAKKEAQGTPFLLELKDGVEVIKWVNGYIKEKG